MAEKRKLLQTLEKNQMKFCGFEFFWWNTFLLLKRIMLYLKYVSLQTKLFLHNQPFSVEHFGCNICNFADARESESKHWNLLPFGLLPSCVLPRCTGLLAPLIWKPLYSLYNKIGRVLYVKKLCTLNLMDLRLIFNFFHHLRYT